MNEIIDVLIEYIRNETGFTGDLTADADLLQTGVLDSFNIVSLALFAQERFGVDLAERTRQEPGGYLGLHERRAAIVGSVGRSLVGRQEPDPKPGARQPGQAFFTGRADRATPSRARLTSHHTSRRRTAAMPASIPRYLLQTANRIPDKVAIVSPERSATFGELLHARHLDRLHARNAILHNEDK